MEDKIQNTTGEDEIDLIELLKNIAGLEINIESLWHCCFDSFSGCF